MFKSAMLQTVTCTSCDMYILQFQLFLAFLTECLFFFCIFFKSVFTCTFTRQSGTRRCVLMYTIILPSSVLFWQLLFKYWPCGLIKPLYVNNFCTTKSNSIFQVLFFYRAGPNQENSWWNYLFVFLLISLLFSHVSVINGKPSTVTEMSAMSSSSVSLHRPPAVTPAQPSVPRTLPPKLSSLLVSTVGFFFFFTGLTCVCLPASLCGSLFKEIIVKENEWHNRK